jgi:sterol desaturase/sphingolipid hydroxylase (fatty acid hydroxylase superfamily)
VPNLGNAALLAQSHGWGVFRALVVPVWLAVITSVILLDLAIYLQHALFHAVPVLWRLHRMHHADLEIDVTTGVRFHPLEILLSMAIKLGVVAALGAPAVAVLIFEVLLNATSMFNHGNVGLPQRLDRVLRWLVVTPDMHRVHHSVVPRETNSNFGFNLPWWDRLCGTYRAQPAAGHQAMTIGIEQFRDPGELRLDRMLLQPLRDDDRVAFVWLYVLCPSVVDAVAIIRSETVIRWHRQGFRAFWRWNFRSRGGRPVISKEIRELIREMSRANWLWGAPRIHGELFKLGIEVAQSTVAKYMVKRPRRPG